MSGSAEVYISVDTEDYGTRDSIEVAISESLRRLGFCSDNGEKYKAGRYKSGVIIEAKSHSCSWEVFEQKWADKLVRDIAVLDGTAAVELYVYNLDREADVVATTHSLFGKEKAQV